MSFYPLEPIRLSRHALYLILGAALLAAALAFLYVASQIDLAHSSLAYDWKILWRATRDGHVKWNAGMFSPPWAVIFVLPLSWLSLNTSWAFMSLLGVAALTFSIPRYRAWQHHLMGVILAISSYSYRRYFTDTNYEAISIIALLVVLAAYRRRSPYWFALGGLLCTIKPQITYLFVLVVALYIFQTTPRAFYLRVSVVVAATVVVTGLWAGPSWLHTLTTRPFDYGISLWVTGDKLGIPHAWLHVAQAAIIAITLSVACLGSRDLSRTKVGMLVAASLLSAPFSNLHSMLVLLAISVIPLALERPAVGVGLLLLFDLPYLAVFDLLEGFQTDYWTAILAVNWAVLTATVAAAECRMGALPAWLPAVHLPHRRAARPGKRVA